MDYYKLGCGRFGKGAWENFFDLELEKKIVFSANYQLKQGDIGAIADGKTVIAVARITGDSVPVTARPELEEELEKKQIEFEDWNFVAPAEIYELEPEEQFQYDYIVGFCQIHKPEVIARLNEIMQKKKKS